MAPDQDPHTTHNPSGDAHARSRFAHALFPLPLHKKVSTNKSTVIVVATGIGVGDAVNVNGTTA